MRRGQERPQQAYAAGRPVARILVAVGRAERADDRSGGEEAQRLGLPAAASVSDPRQRDQIAVAAENQVGERRTRNVCGRDAVARVAAGRADAARAIEADTHAPVARRRQRPAPVVGDFGVGRGREGASQGRLEARAHLGVSLIGWVDRPAQPVWSAAAADRDTPVDRPLRVEEQVVAIVDQQAVVPAQLLPDSLAERLGGDHQRVQRQVASRAAAQLCRIGLGCTDHGLCAHRAAGGAHAARLERGDRGALVDRHTVALAGGAEAAGEPRRVDPRGVGRVAPAPHGVRFDHRGRLGGRQQPAVGRLVADRLGIGVTGTQALPLWAARRQRERTSLDEAAVDPLACDHGADLVDRLVRGRERARHASIAGRTAVGRRAPGQPADRPAAVAPRRPVADDLALQHDHAEVRLVALEVVGGPEAREAGAHDRDVVLALAGERRAWLERAGEQREPHAAGAMVGLQRNVAARGVETVHRSRARVSDLTHDPSLGACAARAPPAAMRSRPRNDPSHARLPGQRPDAQLRAPRAHLRCHKRHSHAPRSATSRPLLRRKVARRGHCVRS